MSRRIAATLAATAVLLAPAAAHANGALGLGGKEMEALMGWTFFLLVFSTSALAIGLIVDTGLLASSTILAFTGGNARRLRRYGWVNLLIAVGVVASFCVAMLACSYAVALLSGTKELNTVAMLAFWVFTPLGATILGALSLIATVMAMVLIFKARALTRA